MDSKRLSNGKKKGEGNVKNGNKYLAWAFIEAANFARRFCPEAKRFYERKKAHTHTLVATKALAREARTRLLPQAQGPGALRREALLLVETSLRRSA